LLARQVSVKWEKADFCSSLEQILDGAELSSFDLLFFPESFYTLICCFAFPLKQLRILISVILYLQFHLSYLAWLYSTDPLLALSHLAICLAVRAKVTEPAVSELGLGSLVTGSFVGRRAGAVLQECFERGRLTTRPVLNTMVFTVINIFHTYQHVYVLNSVAEVIYVQAVVLKALKISLHTFSRNMFLTHRTFSTKILKVFHFLRKPLCFQHSIKERACNRISFTLNSAAF